MKIKCVTGPPGSGKSTYVKEHMGEKDIVYDHDKIAQAVTLRKAHAEIEECQLHVVNRIRFDLFRAAQAADGVETFWMISSKPNDAIKELLGDECEYIEMECTKDEAKERIANDDTRENKEAEFEKVDRFFEEEARMAIRKGREYRHFKIEKREAEPGNYMVRGYASTFEPYVLWTDENGNDYHEQIMPDAFDGADLSDVIFLLNHEGMVHARVKNGTLEIKVDSHGLYTEADLSKTQQARDIYEAIDTGMIDQMSFAFTVTEDSFDRETRTRIIRKIGKVYDVSAVNIPANPGTDIETISARDYFNGVIEAEKAERLEREKEVELRKRKMLLLF